MAKRNRWRRVISVALVAMLVFGAVPLLMAGAEVGAQTGDDGTTNWDFIVPVTHQTTVPAGYTAIRTAQDLDNVRNNLSGNYILMNNIDLSEWGNWVPIGVYKNEADIFSGILDGNGFIISNLSVSVNSNSVAVAGLLGIGVKCEVKNLGIKSSSIIAISSGYNTGAGNIAGGIEDSFITNCFGTGHVTSEPSYMSSPASYCGGIVGSVATSYIESCYNTSLIKAVSKAYNHARSYAGGIAGYIDRESRISYSYNSGDIVASGAFYYSTSTSGVNYAGGITGNARNSHISNCSNRGNIVGSKSVASYFSSTSYLGGISGEVENSEITDCFSNGTLKAEDGGFWVGGIVGTTRSSLIATCYSTDYLDGVPFEEYKRGEYNYPGGIVGVAYSTNVSDCYYANVFPAGILYLDDNSSSSNIQPLTNIQMRQQASFVGFDFNTVWKMPEGGGYPILQWQDDEDGGDPQTTYTISYNANGGTGAPAAQTKMHDTPLTLSSTRPIRSGYTFKGWATSATATTAQYQPGGQYTANASTTLYAVWEVDSSTGLVTKTIAYDGGQTNVKWGEDLFKASSTFYDNDIALLSAALSTAAYNGSKSDGY